MPDNRSRLYLIDGYSNIFRAFYAIRNLSSSKGEPTNAVFGFINMLKKLLREQEPEFIGVALDVGRKTVRSEQYADYKANRSPMPDDLKVQIPYIRRLLEAYRIPMLEVENYEADDVLGTLADRAAEAGYEVVLVSADKDLMQLVGDHVFLMHTGREKLYDAALVTEDFGVPPNQVIDVLALMGDTSDNVPGVPGIGAKGAVTLVKEHGSVETLLEVAPELKRKSYRENLQEHAAAARLSKELVTIHRDLPLPFEPDKLRRDPPDEEALRELFTELEFFSLAEELDSGDGGEAPRPAIGLGSADDWAERTAALGDEILLALVGFGEPVGLAVWTGEETVYADFRNEELAEAVRASLREWIADGDRELVGHDLKEVLRQVPDAVGARGVRCAAALFDTMLASYLLRSAAHSHGFEDLVLDRLGHRALTAKDVGFDRGHQPPPEDERLLALVGERAALLPRLVGPMRKELGEAEDPAERGALAKVYREIEEPLIPILLAMEEAGVLLDVDFLAEMSEEIGAELEQIEEQIYSVAGETFNINSPAQLGVLMFEKLGYPVIRRTRKTKSYATGADVLEELADRGYPLPDLILKFRELSKLKSTYVDALPTLVGDDGRIHTRFNQAVAATGRLSSAHPNLQNIPIRTELGQRIRKAFIAPPGKQLLKADYSQIELRILAHIAEEEALIEAFQRGEDIHQSTAATVFGIDPGLVSPDQRRAAKVINFGILYGMSPFGLAKNLKISSKEAEEFIDAYLSRYPGVKRYMDETLEDAKATGKVETLYGRIRWLPDITSKNRNLRENAKRMAINARIQGTAADVMKIAMIRVAERLAEAGVEARLLLTVHDEVVLEVPEEERTDRAVGELVKREMAGVVELRVPLVVDLGVGGSWFGKKG
ncbi:MAG: DNA polymerase I [Acidobacteriota bacterium]